MAHPTQLALVSAFGAGVAAALLAQFLTRRKRPRVPSSVEVEGCGTVAVHSEKVGVCTHVTLDWLKFFGQLPYKVPFCSAVIDPDGTIYVSGTIGLAPPPQRGAPPAIVPGGPRAEAVRTMQCVEAALAACGAGIEHITMVHIYLSDNTKERFAEMNAGYLSFFGDRPLPARITVGCGALALGAVVEIDVVAKM
eukprot:TRINITY_DN32739_c0_g1_i2.p1 TRINITY_DN32739_c0_g1~~TRINITY_DN32739_c0_g1_i2.p1  ORF type:complete len:194 (-),score=31.76 TRINITY_DN32739_c0_g1_i2:43-624(-)